MTPQPSADFIIYHNPSCSTSRKALEAIRATGVEPTVVQYVKAGWTADQLRQLFSDAGLTAREALRTKQAEGAELAARNPSEDEIIAAMVEMPVLVERPFVVTPKGTRLARPLERISEVL
ncbi:MAG: arsenate reductase (glutaredoxin) [Lautropia sp.]|nr:arsenate reductase (glutaredoxin) [Lautropia sp.]